MDWTSTHQYLDREETIKCDCCGCEFKIKVYKQKGHDDYEEYYCPNCHKKYRTRACITPEIQRVCDTITENKNQK